MAHTYSPRPPRPVTRLAFVTCAALMALLIAAAAAVAAYQFETSWGAAGSSDGQFNSPSFVATGLDGSVYVADTGNNRVEKFTADGAFQLTTGATGQAAGQFVGPTGVAVGP